MAAETAAQLSAMAESSRHVDHAGQVLAAIKGNVERAIESSSAGYQSDAATLFRSTMNQWGSDFAKIITGLERIQNALTHNARHYEATMAADRASVNKIAAALNSDTNI